jgi:P-type Cu+ transporter
MYVAETPDALTVAHGQSRYYFCSSSCVRLFVAPKQEIRSLRIYTAVSFLVGAIIMALMFARAPLFRLLGTPPPSHTTLNLVMLALATPIQFVAGARFYVGFWHAVRARAANMDTLIALGTTTAYLYGAVVALGLGRYGHDTYFDTSVLIIAFILLGRTLEHAMKERATASLRSLAALQPRSVRRVKDGVEQETPIERLEVGDRFRVRPGERIPTDGRIVEGQADVDEALATGESIPVARGVGDDVIGASINTNGTLLIEARRVGRDTFLAQITDLVERAQAGRAPIQRLVDVISARFVPAVLLIATASALLWYFVADASLAQSILVFVAVVIIACPCALGLATPAALLVGVGRGAEHGILVKETGQFELAGRLRTVFFDKTGTLTKGHPEVTDVVAVGGEPRALLEAAAAVEAPSEHPVAQAIVRHAKQAGVVAAKAQGFQAVAGRGVRADLDGVRILAGNQAWMSENQVDVASLAAAAERLESQAKTVFYVARGSEPLGLFAAADALKPGAAETVAGLRRLGIETIIVSGDNERTARAIADQLGVDRVHARVAPGDKAKIVEERKKERIVGFVGDGINDAPAIAAAHVGIALGGGTDVAREAGGLVLLRDDPRDVVNAILLARKTLRKIRQNLFWAFIYNVALIPVAALGLLDPIFAGAAMGLSSVTVVGNSLALRFYRPAMASKGGVRRRPEPPTPSAKPSPRVAAKGLRMAPAMQADPSGKEVDPVCKMRVNPSTTPFRHFHAGKTYYFCSAGCQQRFAAAPDSFLE